MPNIVYHLRPGERLDLGAGRWIELDSINGGRVRLEVCVPEGAEIRRESALSRSELHEIGGSE